MLAFSIYFVLLLVNQECSNYRCQTLIITWLNYFISWRTRIVLCLISKLFAIATYNQYGGIKRANVTEIISLPRI